MLLIGPLTPNLLYWIFQSRIVAPLEKSLDMEHKKEAPLLPSETTCFLRNPGSVSYLRRVTCDWQIPVTHQCGLVPPSSRFPSPSPGFVFTSSHVTKHPAAVCAVQKEKKEKKKKEEPTHIAPSKRPYGLCDWTITATVNLLWMETSTFLVHRRACTLFDVSLWLHQEVCRWSQWRWAKTTHTVMAKWFPSQRAHHAFNLSVTRQWRAGEPVTAVSTFIRILELLEWNETPKTFSHFIFFFFPPRSTLFEVERWERMFYFLLRRNNWCLWNLCFQSRRGGTSPLNSPWSTKFI